MYFFEAKTTNRKKHSTSTFTSDQDTFELVFCPGDSDITMLPTLTCPQKRPVRHTSPLR